MFLKVLVRRWTGGGLQLSGNVDDCPRAEKLFVSRSCVIASIRFSWDLLAKPLGKLGGSTSGLHTENFKKEKI